MNTITQTRLVSLLAKDKVPRSFTVTNTKGETEQISDFHIHALMYHATADTYIVSLHHLDPKYDRTDVLTRETLEDKNKFFEWLNATGPYNLINNEEYHEAIKNKIINTF